ncbi:MFS transporter, partial [Kingella kingae]|nr:MFS transporter [Kingella kingae]
NDNLYKTALFVLISFYGLGDGLWLSAPMMLNVGALLFVLPYFLFSTLAGQLATRYNKARLAQMTKVLEVAIMALAGLGFALSSVSLLMLCLFIMGTQSALFGPVKYAILPEYLSSKQLLMGNGLIESGTFLAILFGQIAGTAIANTGATVITATVVSIAVLGLCSNLAMP